MPKLASCYTRVRFESTRELKKKWNGRHGLRGLRCTASLDAGCRHFLSVVLFRAKRNMDERACQWADAVLLHRKYEILSAEQKEMLQTMWVPGNLEVRHTCARENIHQPSSIQSHGYLLVMAKDEYVITQVSGNVTDLGYTYDDLLSKNLSDIIDIDELEKIPLQAREFKPMFSFPVEFGVGDLKETFTGQFHVRGNWGFLELERPVAQTTSAQLEANILLDMFSQQLSGVKDIAEGCQLLTDVVQQSTGYDKVMTYMFHPDWHGEVVAETIKPGCKVTSFKGLHFPEHDIPRQARACYIRNLYSQSPHVKHEGVPLVPMECPIHQDRPDMTLVSLRSQAPGCIQYYMHMGVQGVLHYSILVNGKLWGLVVCHNHIPGPKFVSFDLRIAVAMTVESFSIFVKEKQQENMNQAFISSKPARRRIHKMVEEGRGLRAALASPQSNILDVLDCSGAAVAFGNKVHRLGTTPTAKQIQRLVEYVSTECKGGLCTTDLSQVWNEALSFAVPSIGCLVQCNVVRSVADRVCMLWFRMPTQADVEWGGDPASSYTSTGMRARHDFSRYSHPTTIPGEPWLETEQEVARKFMEDLGIRDDEPGDTSRTDLRADCPNESSNKAEQQSPLHVVNGEDGPSALPPGASKEPRDESVVKPSSPSSRATDRSPGGTTDDPVAGGGCLPLRKLFRKTDPQNR